tara:strand:+ start:134 stop:475 length:342 start_codon:yes stop_codon:yes gene_type:complete
MNKINLIQDFFEGKIKLWKSFWIAGELIYGFLLLVLLQLDKYLFSELSERSNYLSIFNLNNLSVISKLFLILITIFISIGVWRSAENYKGSIFIILFVFIYYGYRVSSLVLLF